MKTAGVILMILLTGLAGFAQRAGDLDVTFDGDGKVTTSIGSSHDEAYSIAIQPDGKIVAVGYSLLNISNYDFAVVRYNSDGTLDSSFGSNGKVTTDLGLSEDFAQSVKIQPDGKIIVEGRTAKMIRLIRYNTNGSLDSTFGIGGQVYTSLRYSGNLIEPLILQPDGKILIGGAAYSGSNADVALARYNTDGSLDSSFGTGGQGVSAIGTGDDVVTSLAVQHDGKIVVACCVYDGVTSKLALARFNTTGTLDNSFGENGKVIMALSWVEEYREYNLAIKSNDMIVVAGVSYNGLDRDFALARLNTDGSLDNSFNVNTDIGTNQDDYPTSLTVQPDGKIVVAGVTVGSNLSYDFALARYNSDGTLDSSFSTDGRLTTSFSVWGNFATSVAIQPDGEIVVAGYSNNSTDDDFALARYLPGLNVGILSFSPAENVLLYPNPLHNNEVLEYSLQQDEVLTIGLYDVSGRLVKQLLKNASRSKGSHKESLHFGEALLPGNYLLSITNGSGRVSIKVVKE